MARPPSPSDRRGPAFRHGLEASVIAGGIRATYSAASRGGTADRTAPGGNILVYQFGAGIQYWLGANVRATFNYMAYVAPDDDAESPVILPGDLLHTPGHRTDHVLHEVGLRLGGSL